MNENPTSSGGGNLMENDYVKETFSILQDNGKDTSWLTSLIKQSDGLEDYIKQSENKMAEMKTQLDAMQEVQDHPIKSALQKTIAALEIRIAEMKEKLGELKTNIVEGCKNTVAAFKEKGAAALNKVASFFKLKSGLKAIKNDAELSVKLNDKSIAKIETFSQEYHKAGRALKNMARVAVGKKPVDAAKESGKLAKVMKAPYKASIAINVAIGKQVDKMIASLDKLEKGVENKRGEQAVKPKKPTLMERLETNKEKIKQRELEAPKVELTKKKGLEV